jgi:hypothetical protein
MPEHKNARLLSLGDTIADRDGKPDVVRGVQVVAQMASGRTQVFQLPADVELMPPVGDLPAEADLPEEAETKKPVKTKRSKP